MNSQQQQQQQHQHQHHQQGQGQGQQNQQPPPPSSQGPPSQADSPFDLSSFIAFPTANSIGHLPAGNDDLYRSFAQGIKSTSNGQGQGGGGNGAGPSGSTGGMDGGYPAAGGYQQQQQQGGPPGRSQGSNNKTGGGNGNGTGGGQAGANGLNPYGLDPSAFHGEVRFQLPAFLNPTNSRPAYPNGAEAWSGYGNNSTKALEGMYNQSLAGGSKNRPQGAGMSANPGNGNNNNVNGSNNTVGYGNQMGNYGQNNGGQGNGNLGWSNNGGKVQGMGGSVGTPGVNGNGMSMGDGHNDSGGFDQWDNWNFSVDGSKPFMPNGFGFDASNPGNIVQSPYTITNVQNIQRNTAGQQGGLNNANNNGNNMTPRNGGPLDMSMPTSALLPNSAFPTSSAFASTSRMNFGQDTVRSAQGNISGNGNFQGQVDENAFASSVSDNMASNTAASLIASNGLGSLVNPGTLATQTPAGPNMPGLYSTTGFDIVSVLAKVANRKDPKTVLGPVDCSCSFVVSDVRKFDSPIVYTSPTFSQLTGYEAREILGRNCRFLQSPDAEVAKGSRRKYTDNVAVAHMKRLLQAGKECQASLINYRKGGTPFINLVTVVPITWDSDEIVYHVGFQVDLVEQPNAILRNMRDGSYQVNYTVQNNPQPPMKPAAKPIVEPPPPTSIGISRQMLALLPQKTQSAVLAGGEEVGKSEWLQFVLANTDDFVHVLSLKGQFQYVSPSVTRVLEYEPEDLLNKHISDICHPSDIVPVMRELKDATHTPTEGRQPQAINMLFRVRRKLSGYIWLESSGRLQVESGKGRKAMVLTGRDRTLPAFCWKALDDHGGLSDTEVWAKVSLDGLLLWVTGSIGEIFGARSSELIGKSIYSFMAGGEEGPPGPDGHSSSLAVEKAISTSAEGLPKRGATSVRHQLVGFDGRTREVTSNFFAAGSSSAGPITPPRESPTASDDDLRSNISGIMEALPFQILVQIKSSPTGIQKPKSAIVHPLSENVFEEMDTTRGTSWQYEVHQLKTANRKLKDDIQALRTGNKTAKSSDAEDDIKRAKGKKRKANESGPQPTTDHPTPLHQQTPGFGLAPGQLFKTWS